MSVLMANGISQDAFKVLVVLWFFFSATFSIRASVTAQRQLLHEFRRLATEPKTGAAPDPREEEEALEVVAQPTVTKSYS
jgi:plasmid stabilization system protein ParE